jgi:hypothetical protein
VIRSPRKDARRAAGRFLWGMATAMHFLFASNGDGFAASAVEGLA